MQALGNLRIPKRPTNKPLRIPISNLYKLGGIGLVACGRIESGQLTRMKLTKGVGCETKNIALIGSIATPFRVIGNEEYKFDPIPAG